MHKGIEMKMRINMVKTIKGYLVFTSFVYRIAMFGILPLALITLDICGAAFMGDDVSVLFVVMPLLMIMAEILADTWMFGGIQGKDAAKIDFLKTSPKGMGLLRNALTMDLARRLCSMSGVMTACVLVNLAWGVEMFGGDAVKGLGVVLSLILSSYTISVLCIILARFGTMFWQSILVSYLGLFLESVCVGFLMAVGHPFVWSLVYAVLAAGVSVLAVKVVMNKVKGGYYDK